jgi:hypothetical protein
LKWFKSTCWIDINPLLRICCQLSLMQFPAKDFVIFTEEVVDVIEEDGLHHQLLADDTQLSELFTERYTACIYHKSRYFELIVFTEEHGLHHQL